MSPGVQKKSGPKAAQISMEGFVLHSAGARALLRGAGATGSS
jgi:hypothetical protein